MNNEDMSDIVSKLNNISGSNNISPDMVNNLFNMLNNSSLQTQISQSDNSSVENNNFNTSSKSQQNSFDNSGIDIETIMRMKSIIDKINIKDDPRSNLLQSLKPYLKESRKSKIDQYIQLMNMSKVMDIFPIIGGDKKNG